MADTKNNDQIADEATHPLVSPTDDNPETDKAVEEIVRNEGDEELKEQDAAADKSVVMRLSRWERFKNFQADWWSNPKKRWCTIAVIVIVIAAPFAIPLTRYELIGLFVREKVTVEAVDNKSGDPVSGVQVNIGTVKGNTDAKGKAILYVHAGSRQLVVDKKYYAGSTQRVLVTLSATSNIYKAKLRALGRQVKVQVDNTITGKPIGDAQIDAGGAIAKTNDSGMAEVVLPSGASTQSAVISLNGYNDANVTITAGGSLVQDTFKVTPAGNLYFLSNLSGTIDVVKTNLDGTNRQTVLAGTGNEDPNNTSLSPSPDWKYLALLAKRSGSTASLYLIDTTNDNKLTTIDQGNATFIPIGWVGDRFIYEVNRSSTISNWQPDQFALKSYDPTTGQILLLDQTQVAGNPDIGANQDMYLEQVYGSVYLIDNQVIYTKNWQGINTENPDSYPAMVDGKQAELDVIGADGSNPHSIKQFAPSNVPSDGTGYVSIALNSDQSSPDSLYLWFNDNVNNDNSFYDYENDAVTTDSSMTSQSFYNVPSQGYLLSPSGDETFWTEQRDGANTLIVADSSGDNQKQVATLSSYSPYGWYTDNYLLVAKDSELYVMPATGGTPIHVSDYFNSPNNGGYGGQ